MKYKLININTKEEHLCDKVIIDGFDYYVTDNPNDLGGWHIDKEFKILSNVSRFNVVTEMREIIATNNLNINIPKVIDEVEELAEKWCDQFGEVWNAQLAAFIAGYNKHAETHPFSEEDMIKFAEWLLYSPEATFSTPKKELLQLWKEQQPKIVYYE